ncbi:MAG: IS1182 family transposase [Nitrospirota bacterium]|nr:IS1182 family transposase [Nitrospirota bacterium]
MAERFVTVDRETPLLLPPDLRDWVPEDDMVHFVLEAVKGVDMSAFRVNWRGTGSRQYPPHMMLALLIYCYSHGIFGSRRIERATYRDVAVRLLSGDTHPDHDTICKFRRENKVAFSAAFLHVLELAREVGVLKVGTVSVDGTHIRANASKDCNVSYERAGELREQLENDIGKLLKQAEEADQDDEDEGERLPEKIARREKLLAKMEAARQRLEEEAKRRAEAEKKGYEEKLKAREKRTGRKKGPKPRAPKDTPEPKQQTNLTDGESGLMRKSKRESFTQSYNAQIAVDADGSQLILSTHVSRCASDANELKPTLEGIPQALGRPDRALADSGYANAAVIGEVEAGGIDLYVSVGREDGNYERNYDYRPEKARSKPPKKVTDERLLAMQAKLASEEGKKIYRKRQQTVEPVFGIIKAAMGFRQFLLRGLAEVGTEWDLVCLAYNMKRLWKAKSAAV